MGAEDDSGDVRMSGDDDGDEGQTEMIQGVSNRLTESEDKIFELVFQKVNSVIDEIQEGVKIEEFVNIAEDFISYEFHKLTSKSLEEEEQEALDITKGVFDWIESNYVEDKSLTQSRLIKYLGTKESEQLLRTSVYPQTNL